MSRLTIDRVALVFREGVESVERIASEIGEGDWKAPACGRWTAAQTARHLAAVAHWYHDWLDRALAGDASAPFAASELDERNDDALAAFSEMTGPDAISEFANTATAYLARAREHWDLAYGYPFGTVTVGLHCGVAAAEWHLHAWDLSQLSDRRHQPQHATALFTAAGLCQAEAMGGVRGNLLRILVPLGARWRPWSTVLSKSGRNPEKARIKSWSAFPLTV